MWPKWPSTWARRKRTTNCSSKRTSSVCFGVLPVLVHCSSDSDHSLFPDEFDSRLAPRVGAIAVARFDVRLCGSAEAGEAVRLKRSERNGRHSGARERRRLGVCCVGRRSCSARELWRQQRERAATRTRGTHLRVRHAASPRLGTHPLPLAPALRPHGLPVWRRQPRERAAERSHTAASRRGVRMCPPRHHRDARRTHPHAAQYGKQFESINTVTRVVLYTTH